MPTSSRKKVAASTSIPTKQTRSSRRSSTRGNKAKDKEEDVLVDDTSKNNDAPIPSAEELKGSNNEKADGAEPQVKKTEQKEEGDSKPAAIDQSQANMNNNNMMMQHQTSNNQYLPSNAYMGSNDMMGMMNNFSPMAMSNYDPAMQAAMMQMMQNNGGGGGSFNYPQAVVQTSAAEAKNFPETLFDVISEEDTNHIVSWLAHGKGFMITDKQAFAKVLLPKYFDGCKVCCYITISVGCC